MGYIGSQPATNFETVRKQVSTTNSGTTITLDYSVSSVQDILVTVNAVVQSYDNYTVSGTTLTLGGTLNNDRVEILYVGRTFQTVTPAVGTVTNDMLAGSIANSKLANSSITLNGSAVSLGGSATVGSDFGTSYFAANRTTDFTVTDQTFVKAQIDNEIVDVGNNYDTSNYRYVVPTTGKYFFYVRGYMDAEVDSHLHAVEFYLKKNNSTYVAETIIDFQSNNGRKGGTTLTTIVDLSASDYIEWWIYAKDSTGNPILKSNGSSVAGGGNQFGGWRVA